VTGKMRGEKRKIEVCWYPKQLQLVCSVVLVLVAVVEGLKVWGKLITYVNVAASDGEGKRLRG